MSNAPDESGYLPAGSNFTLAECKQGAKVKKLETRVYKRLQGEMLDIKKEIEQTIKEMPLAILADQNVDTERAHLLWQQQKIQLLYTMQEKTLEREQRKKPAEQDQKVINRCIRIMMGLLIDASPELRKSNMAQHEMKHGKRSIVVKGKLPNVNDWLSGKEEPKVDNPVGQKTSDSPQDI